MKKIGIILFILLLSCNTLYSDYTEFRNMDINEGLSQNTVTDIIQDKYGLIWIATEDGLNLYDGQELQTFNTTYKEKCKLQNDIITDLEVDSSGTLWIGTYGGGLLYFNHQEYCFRSPIKEYGSYDRLVEKITYDEKSNEIWAATNGEGLLRYSIDSNKKYTYRYNNDNLDKRNHLRSVMRVLNYVYAGTDDGHLFIYNILKDDIKTIKLSNSPITDIEKTDDNKLILTSEGDYLKLIDLSNHKENQLEHSYHIDEFNKLKTITSVSKTGVNEFTLSTLTRGIYKIKLVDNKLTFLDSYNVYNSNLPTDSFLSILKDDQSTLWAGSNGFGLYYYNDQAEKFQSINNQYSKHRLDFKSVRAINKFDDKLWVGGYGGLNKINFEEEENESVNIIDFQVENYTWNNYLQNQNIYTLKEDKNNNDIIWIGTEGGGLYKYSKSRDKYKLLKSTQDFDSNAVHGQSIYQIEFYENKLIIGTSKGLNIYDPNTQNSRKIDKLEKQIKSPQFYAKSILIDNDWLYIVVDKEGVFKYNLKTDELINLQHIFPALDDFIFDNVFSIKKYKDHNYFLCTKENGLIILDEQNRNFKIIDNSDGLINNGIYLADYDNDGGVWVSSIQGISYINLKNNYIQNFTRDFFRFEGEFNSGAYFKDKEGIIYFGGVSGVVYFDPEKLLSYNYDPKIIIKNIEVNYDQIIKNYHYYNKDTLYLDYTDDLIEIQLANTEFIYSEKLEYYYRLNEGEWYKKERKLNLTGVKSGVNKFEIELRTYDNKVSDKRTLYIDVGLPIWQRAWFIGLTVLSILILIYIIYKLNLKNVERKNLELGKLVNERTKELKESESKYRLLAENITDVIWIVDKNLDFIYCSPSFLHLYGKKYKNIKDFNAREVFSKNDIEKLNTLLRKNKRNEVSKSKSFNYEFFKNKDNGEQLYTEVNVGFFIDDDGEVAGLLGVSRDISQRVNAERTLKEREILFSSLVNNILEPVLITNWQGEILFANVEAKKVLNLKQENISENSIFDFLIEQNLIKFHADFSSIKAGNPYIRNQYKFHVKNSDLYIEGSSTKIIYFSRSAFLFSFRDITERTLLINKLSKAKTEAEKVSAAKSSYLANLTHELKTPINAISGFSDILLEKIKQKEYKDYISSIKTSSKLLLDLINDLLYFTKTETNNVELKYSSVNIQKVLSEIENIFKLQVKNKSLDFKVNCNLNDINEKFNLDEGKIKQILINLINNAILNTKTGEIIVEVDAKKQTKSTAEIEFKIHDTGTGIPDDKLKDIFAAYKQVSIDEGMDKGTGLGLAIVKKLVDTMNGEINVESELGKGSTFTVHLKNIQLSIDTAARSKKKSEDYLKLLEDILKNDDLSKYDSDTLMGLHSKLNGSFEVKLKNIKNKYLLKDIIEFSDELKQLAQNYKVDFVKMYAKELQNATKSIEVEKINVLLNNFNKLPNYISQELEKKHG